VVEHQYELRWATAAGWRSTTSSRSAALVHVLAGAAGEDDIELFKRAQRAHVQIVAVLTGPQAETQAYPPYVLAENVVPVPALQVALAVSVIGCDGIVAAAGDGGRATDAAADPLLVRRRSRCWWRTLCGVERRRLIKREIQRNHFAQQ
jgi:hypothetical protein